MSTFLSLLVIVVALSASFMDPAAGADDTYYVTRPDDPQPPGVCDSDCSFREAVVKANAKPGRQIVSLARLTRSYLGDTDVIVGGLIDEDFAQTGDIDVIGPLTVVGAGKTISAGGGNDRVLHVREATASTLQGDLLLTDVTLIGGGRFGGGVYNGGRATIKRSLITQNDVIAGGPGSGGAIENIGTLVLDRSTVSDNKARFGGGVMNYGDMTIKDSLVTGNLVTSAGSDSNGGGIANDGNLSVIRSRIVGNESVGNGAGIQNTGILKVVQSRIGLNDSAADGGGVENRGTLESIASTFDFNEADSGGGLLNAVGGTATIRRSTFWFNQIRINGFGGGIENRDSLAVSYTTFTTNSPDEASDTNTSGLGIATTGGGGTFLRASVLDNNYGDHPSEDCSGTVISEGYNVFQNMSGCAGVTNGSNGDVVVGAFEGVGATGENGGPTLTAPIDAFHPARDHVPASESDCRGKDQRGVPRPANNDCDSGAYELTFCGPKVVNVVGTSGADRLYGGSIPDGVLALGGNDVIVAGSGADAICAGPGDDTLYGADDDDQLRGEEGNDRCFGEQGDDAFSGCEFKKQ
jgi:hypothetical protein